MENKNSKKGKRPPGRPPKPRAEGAAEETGRKCHSFYCTSDEYLWLHSYLDKMRKCIEDVRKGDKGN